MSMQDQTKPLTGRTVLLCLLVFFGVVIGVNGVMIKLALDTLPGTEVNSSYAAGLAYNSEINAAHDQEARGWRVDAQVERNPDGHASVKLQARDHDGTPVTGVEFFARLERPADKRADRLIKLRDHGGGAYGGNADEVRPGQWDLVLVAERDTRRLFLSKNRVVLK